MAQAAIRRQKMGVADEANGGSTRAMAIPRAVRRLGFWAAIVTAITYIVFDLGTIGGPDMLKLLSVPWDVYIPIGASILIAPSFLLLTIAIHYSAPEWKRVWTHAAVAFGTMYAALVSLVYVTWLFVVEPHVINHTESAVAPFAFAQGSFIQMVDGIGYTFMGVAAALTAPVFGGDQLGRWIRWVAIANAPGAALVLVAYIVYSLAVGLPTAILFPAYSILLAVYYRRAGGTIRTVSASAPRADLPGAG
jgi:hypothetical protein